MRGQYEHANLQSSDDCRIIVQMIAIRLLCTLHKGVKLLHSLADTRLLAVLRKEPHLSTFKVSIRVLAWKDCLLLV